MTWWWSWILTAGGVIGLYLAGQKRAIGWAVGLAMQVLWVAYAIATDQLGFLVSAGAYGSVYTRNLVRWRREERERVVVLMSKLFPPHIPFAPPVVVTHFLTYGGSETTCGILSNRHTNVHATDRRKNVTCADCQSRMTDFGDLPHPTEQTG